MVEKAESRSYKLQYGLPSRSWLSFALSPLEFLQNEKNGRRKPSYLVSRPSLAGSKLGIEKDKSKNTWQATEGVVDALVQLECGIKTRCCLRMIFGLFLLFYVQV